MLVGCPRNSRHIGEHGTRDYLMNFADASFVTNCKTPTETGRWDRWSVLIVVALVICGAVAQTDVASAQILPNGIAHDIIVDGFQNLSGLAVLPDGRVLIFEHLGRVMVWARGQVLCAGAIPDIATGGEDGLIAGTIDPAWPAKPYVYLYFSHEDSTSSARTNRLVRYSVIGDLLDPESADLQLDEAYVIIDDIPSDALIHNGGDVDFADDGTLFLSIGDNSEPCMAQDVDSMLGKVLRLDISGLPSNGGGPPLKSALVPSAHPFSGSDVANLVFCCGLRNPFRIDYDNVHGLIVGDVGASSQEEVNVATGGENFGWPLFEGNQPRSNNCPGPTPTNLVAPIVARDHSGPLGFTALTLLGGIYRNPPGGTNSLGAAYEGQLFFADLGFNSAVYRVQHDGLSWTVPPQVPGQITPDVWAVVGFPSDAETGPDGSIWYVNYTVGYLGRVRSTTNGTHLTIVSGDNQIGNAGTNSFWPLVVELNDDAGNPVAGEDVWFGVERGGGSVPRTVATNGSGRASALYTFGSTYDGMPRVKSQHATSAPVSFDLEWRGLVVGQAPGVLALSVVHSQGDSPLMIAAQAAPGMTPYFSFASGDVWTSVLSPVTGYLVVGDGIGVNAPAAADWVTDAMGTFTRVYNNIPPTGGVTLDFQAYAFDWTLPFPAAVFVSNRATVTLP